MGSVHAVLLRDPWALSMENLYVRTVEEVADVVLAFSCLPGHLDSAHQVLYLQVFLGKYLLEDSDLIFFVKKSFFTLLYSICDLILKPLNILVQLLDLEDRHFMDLLAATRSFQRELRL